MSDFTTTPNLGLFKPTYDADEDQWGFHWNQNADVLDAQVVTRGGGVAIVGTSPTSTVYEPLWWDSNSGQLFVQYNDGSSTQWVSANSIDASSLEGSFLPLTGGTMTGNITIGTGVGIPFLVVDGAAGTSKGIDLRNAGTLRWRLSTDASDNLGLYAYNTDGTYNDLGFLFDPVAKQFSTKFRLYGNVSNATPVNGVTGFWFAAQNTGANAANGHKFTYASSSGAGGHDIGLTHIATYNPNFVAGQNPACEAIWFVSISPNDPTNFFGCNVGELNVVNRGPDVGWMRDRSGGAGRNPTGHLLLVPETTNFGAPGGGEGVNVTYGISTSRSGATNSTGFPAKFYNNFLIEPNSTVGLTGRAIYATGDITGTASQYPYGPLQLDGTWLHGIDHSLATYTDTLAEIMKPGQSIAWINGPTSAPTSLSSITANGAGANVSLILTTAGTGTVRVGTGTGTQALTLNGAAGQNNGVGWQTNSINRWRLVTDASDNLSLFAYDAGGGFLGTVLAVGQSPFQFYIEQNCQFQLRVGFNNSAPIAKPTVSGAKGSNAALASLLTALASYGLITDGSTA